MIYRSYANVCALYLFLVIPQRDLTACHNSEIYKLLILLKKLYDCYNYTLILMLSTRILC